MIILYSHFLKVVCVLPLRLLGGGGGGGGGILTQKSKKVIYVDRASKINTSKCANGSTNLLSFREN